MLEVVLKCSTSDGSREIKIEGEKTSFGRGSEATNRFADEGLSRLHSTVYRDGDRVWIVDENSTNGTFVNGEKVSASGTALENGDVIKIGNYTNIKVKISDQTSTRNESFAAEQAKNFSGNQTTESAFQPHSSLLIPLAITAFALLIVAVSAVFIGVKVFGTGSSDQIVYKSDEREFDAADDSFDEENENKPEKSPTPKTAKTTEAHSNENLTESPEALNNGTAVAIPSGKKYQTMSEEERNRYIAAKAEKVARIIGNQKSEPIPPDAVQEIKKYINGYAGRLSKARNDNCTQKGWVSSDFVTVLERATKNAPFINRYFNAEGIDPQLGIYVAMIESEHCACLESPTHAKGMFQFLASSAPDYGLNPDERCEPEAAAKGAARYLKSLIGRFGTAPDSVPLAIASYNSGQGNLSKNLDTVFAAAANQNRSFWTLAANKNVMEGSAGKQFNNENIKYVPKFFATAIIGENPQDFGVNLQPLSTYTK